MELLGERLERLGEGLELQLITDQSRYISQSVTEVLQTAFIGGGLAILILMLFLRDLKSTIIIGISIPVSVVATFFLMFVSGISLNIMSLGGITLGIGLLVDNSIVVLESIQRKREDGLDIVEAARAGAGEVGQAVIASTMTTVCVFVPIVFVEGVAGQLFGDQALTVTYSLTVSLFVALTLIPMLASRKFGAAPPEDVPEHSRSKIAKLVIAAVDFVGLSIARLRQMDRQGFDLRAPRRFVRAVEDLSRVLWSPERGLSARAGRGARAALSLHRRHAARLRVLASFS